MNERPPKILFDNSSWSYLKKKRKKKKKKREGKIPLIRTARSFVCQIFCLTRKDKKKDEKKRRK